MLLYLRRKREAVNACSYLGRKREAVNTCSYIWEEKEGLSTTLGYSLQVIVLIVQYGLPYLLRSAQCCSIFLLTWHVNKERERIYVTVHAKTLRKSAILISRYRSRRHERQFILFSRFFAHKVRIPS